MNARHFIRQRYPLKYIALFEEIDDSEVIEHPENYTQFINQELKFKHMAFFVGKQLGITDSQILFDGKEYEYSGRCDQKGNPCGFGTATYAYECDSNSDVNTDTKSPVQQSYEQLCEQDLVSHDQQEFVHVLSKVLADLAN